MAILLALAAWHSHCGVDIRTVMPNQKDAYFELHAGFPKNDFSAAAADAFLRRRPGGKQWSRSEVTAQHVKSASCFDPHNVPGDLGSLVSCSVPGDGSAAWDSVVSDVVVPTAEAALSALNQLGAKDSRLEIECPFGWLGVREVNGNIVRHRSVFEPVRISPQTLQRLPGRMSGVPEWEIHFVAEPRPDVRSVGFSMLTLPEMIEEHGVDIEQTIQYRSEAMLRAGSNHHKFISTSYYPTPADVVKEATRLFEGTSLATDLWNRGYTLELILEHIVGCFEPSVGHGDSRRSDALSEVNSAR